jgi:hypothetical protein
MTIHKIFLWSVMLLIVLSSCSHKKESDEDSAPAQVKTPVTVTTISYEPMEDAIELNATSTYLQKTIVKATTTGFIKTANTSFGKRVSLGQPLFTIKTKEAESIGNTINKLDPSFRFSGLNMVRAAAAGFITELNHKQGDYVQDGEQLGVISDARSFVFLLDVPYEYHALIMSQRNLPVTLPDGERLLATMSQLMPTADSSTQTQTVALKVNPSHLIPQNVVAKVKISRKANAAATTLPKQRYLAMKHNRSFG